MGYSRVPSSPSARSVGKAELCSPAATAVAMTYDSCTSIFQADYNQHQQVQSSRKQASTPEGTEGPQGTLSAIYRASATQGDHLKPRSAMRASVHWMQHHGSRHARSTHGSSAKSHLVYGNIHLGITDTDTDTWRKQQPSLGKWASGDDDRNQYIETCFWSNGPRL